MVCKIFGAVFFGMFLRIWKLFFNKKIFKTFVYLLTFYLKHIRIASTKTYLTQE